MAQGTKPGARYRVQGTGPEQKAETDGRQLVVSCPFCGSTEVELFSLFGSQLLTSEYYCRNCHTIFEQVKR